MPRTDISDKLSHFTSGANDEEAFERLCAIVETGRLIGSDAMIRGRYRCVCFTEAPLVSLPDGLVNPDAYSRYRPFGLLFDKSWVFAQGGRPVIYQTDDEFADLPDAMRWRHVRYEPNREVPIDFTWEREWRLQRNELIVNPAWATLILPNATWLDRLREAYDEQQDWLVEEYAQMVEKPIAEQYRRHFTWRATHLDER